MVRSQVSGEVRFPGDSQLPSSTASRPWSGLAASTARGFYRHRPISWREARFACILLAVVLMSLADLSMTLIHATTIGMQEENPIARVLMRHGGICSLCIWKGGTVAIGVFILWRVRRHACAEVGAWICFAILAALCFHWARYNSQISGLTTEVLSLEKSRSSSEWFVMQPGPTP